MMSQPLLPSCSSIKVYNWRRGSKEWETSWIRHGDHDQPSQEVATHNFDVTIFYLTHLRYYDYESNAERDSFWNQYTTEPAHCHSCVGHLESSFTFLSFWWKPPYFDSNGCFGYEDELDEDGNIVSVSIAARFLIQHFNAFRSIDEAITHKWRDVTVLTNWVKATKKTKILLLSSDVAAIKRIIPEILQRLQGYPLTDPLWPYITIIADYLNQQHTATYAIRDLTESQERRAKALEHSEPAQRKTDYARLHEIARHALTVTEILTVNIKTLDHIVQYHKEFMEQEKTHSNSRLDMTVRRIHQRLLLYSHIVYSTCCRCSSYQDRMKNEIQLAFNVVSQDEAHTSVEIAKAAKADSQAMKVTSLVALVFLPPTFISAIFSTSFFDFGSDESSWMVSKKFYIYWLVILPITITSVLLWYFFNFESAVAILTPKFLMKKASRMDSVDVEK